MTHRANASRPSFRGQPVDLLVDVRSRLEYWMGHLNGAAHVPVDIVAEELPQRPGISSDSHIVVYCASGARSAAAAASLRAAGFRRVTDAGGMAAAAAEYVAA
jgi:rhodanese-related sulfurtransferase